MTGVKNRSISESVISCKGKPHQPDLLLEPVKVIQIFKVKENRIVQFY